MDSNKYCDCNGTATEMAGAFIKDDGTELPLYQCDECSLFKSVDYSIESN